MGKYDDIIELPHHVSSRHPRMPFSDRAAQFMPFAALTGYGDAVNEAGRLTDARPDLEESYMETLNRKLRDLNGHLSDRPAAEITYFEPDLRKEGGKYRTVRGRVRKIDTFESLIILESGERIPVKDIFDISLLPEG